MKRLLTIFAMILFFTGMSAAGQAHAAVTDVGGFEPEITTTQTTDTPVITGRSAVAKLLMWTNNTTGKSYTISINYMPPLTASHTTFMGYTVYTYKTGNNATYYGVDYLP